MKILFFNTFSAVNGGAERLLYDTSATLLSKHIDVSIVFACDDSLFSRKDNWLNKINRYYLPELTYSALDQNDHLNYLGSAQYKECIRYLNDIVDIENPDLIHIHNFPSLDCFRQIPNHLPIIKTFHSYEYLCGRQLRLLPNQTICQHVPGEMCTTLCGSPEKQFKRGQIINEIDYMIKRFSRLTAVSQYIADIMMQVGIPEKKIEVLPNFTTMDSSCEKPSQEKAVLFVGRITPEKGLAQLIDIINLTKTKPKLLIAGADGLFGNTLHMHEVIEHADSVGIAYEVIGWKRDVELKKTYQRSTLVAVCSNWPEPFGLVGIEAMINKRPVVAFDVGGVSEWLSDGQTGFLVPPGDINAFAERIDQLVRNPQLREHFGMEAEKQCLQKFSPAKYMRKLLTIYGDSIHERPSD